MNADKRQKTLPLRLTCLAPSVTALLLLGACSSLSVPGGPDLINAPPGGTERAPTAARPEPDSRGVISYPNYQVAIARNGDTVATVAGRLGLDAVALANANGLPADSTLSSGEVIYLPTRVATDAGLAAGGSVDVATLAGSALDRADGGTSTSSAAPVIQSAGAEPDRHTVKRGETAYSIARQYNVSAKALADWNGLDGDLSVREGQILLIPVATGAPTTEALATTTPGTGTPTPTPPSASAPQPASDLPSVAAAGAAAVEPVSTEVPIQQTKASDTTSMVKPVNGSIIRAYDAGKNDGVDFSAAAGSPVKAADAGTVAAITQDVDQVPIVVLRHSGNLLTVYANVDGLKVAKGDKVSRGQQIGTVRKSDPDFLHFEVRKGFDSVDPVPYLTN